MTTSEKRKGGASGEASLFSNIVKFGVLAFFNALALALGIGFVADGNLALAIVIGLIAVGADVAFFVPALYPIRWMVPGLAFVSLLVIYPIFVTVSTSFSNYGDGHLFTKDKAIALITARKFASDDAKVYTWDVMQHSDGRYALWLTREANGTTEVAFAPEGSEILEVTDGTIDAPDTYEGFTLLKGANKTAALGVIQTAIFGTGDDTVGIKGRKDAARPLSDQFVYDASLNIITDQSTNKIYVANDITGEFEPQNGQGDILSPGYRVNVGAFNFTRLLEDPDLRGPLVDIFVWNVSFSVLSVITTFSLGLMMALVLNNRDIVGRKVIQSILIIPYAIPGVISIVVWRALLNQNLGLINKTLGTAIPFLNDAAWSKFAILLVNLWLGYPYMMLVCSGALQAIPSDIYEAAAVDGAKPRQRFLSITIPLLLVTIGPLLIASFTYNFNNFMIIDALTGGNPPILGSPVPAGYTDILISYTYRLAFGSRGADYGYASAITIVIFFLVAIVTLLQFRFTRQWEEVGDNV